MPEVPVAETYDFSIELQREILSMLLVRSKELVMFRDVVKAVFFENPCHKMICEVLFEFFEKYSRAPSHDEITEETISAVAKKDATILEETSEELIRIFKVIEEKDDFDYLKDKAVEFAKFAAMKNAIISGAKMLRTRRDYVGVRKGIEEAMMVGESHEDLGAFYFQDLESRLLDRKSGLSRKDLAIGTGFTKLDAGLYGGIAPGEVGIIMGPSKRGKTAVMVNFALGHAFKGKSVIHFAMEGSEESITARYDSKISGVPVNDLQEHEEEVRDAVAYFQECSNKKTGKGVGQVIVKKFYAHCTTPTTLEAHLQRLRLMSGFNADVVMVDYLGLMSSSSKTAFSADSSGKYLMMGQITKELISLAQRYGYALWIAHQGTRGSKSKEVVDLEDAADSFEPMRDADIILTLNQSYDESEKKPQEYRMYIAGGRAVPDKKMFGFFFDPARMTFTENENFIDLRGREEPKKKSKKGD